MARYRQALPQLAGELFLTDGGIETTLIFHNGLELPHFAAFHLLREPGGEAALQRYFRSYLELAQRYRCGFILESATWRSSADWGQRLGYSAAQLADANRQAIALLEALRDEADLDRPVVISGCVGPRGDGYQPDLAMTADSARDYHQQQIDTFADTAADMVCAITMNNAEEAEGIARAAQRAQMPVALSFTVETDGRLPTGQSLAAAIEQVDDSTAGYPCYYMINCAHPSHFRSALGGNGWRLRLRGIRANASRKSHAELDACPTLDSGDPEELGRDYAALLRELPRLNVLGGCCGTDLRHLDAIAAACAPPLQRR